MDGGDGDGAVLSDDGEERDDDEPLGSGDGLDDEKMEGERFTGTDGKEYCMSKDDQGVSTIYVASSKGKGGKRKWFPLKKGKKGGGRGKGNGARRSQGPPSANPKFPCRYCKEVGHWGDECPNPPEWAKAEIAARKAAREAKGKQKGNIKLASAVSVAAGVVSELPVGSEAVSSTAAEGSTAAESFMASLDSGKTETGVSAVSAVAGSRRSRPIRTQSLEIVGIKMAENSATSGSKTGRYHVVVDPGAGDNVQGSVTHKRWMEGLRPVRRYPSNKLFRFGDGRLKRGLFKCALPAYWARVPNPQWTHIVAGHLGTLLGDPMLGENRGVMDYFSVPGQPRLIVDVPTGQRCRKALERAEPDHWTADLGPEADGELLCGNDPGIVFEGSRASAWSGDETDPAEVNVASSQRIGTVGSDSELPTDDGKADAPAMWSWIAALGAAVGQMSNMVQNLKEQVNSLKTFRSSSPGTESKSHWETVGVTEDVAGHFIYSTSSVENSGPGKRAAEEVKTSNLPKSARNKLYGVLSVSERNASSPEKHRYRKFS